MPKKVLRSATRTIVPVLITIIDNVCNIWNKLIIAYYIQRNNLKLFQIANRQDRITYSGQQGNALYPLNVLGSCGMDFFVLLLESGLDYNTTAEV